MDKHEVDPFLSELWDSQIEEDLKAGRLDALLEETKQDLERERCDVL
jgi:hypothetical protein